MEYLALLSCLCGRNSGSDGGSSGGDTLKIKVVVKSKCCSKKIYYGKKINIVVASTGEAAEIIKQINEMLDTISQKSNSSRELHSG